VDEKRPNTEEDKIMSGSVMTHTPAHMMMKHPIAINNNHNIVFDSVVINKRIFISHNVIHVAMSSCWALSAIVAQVEHKPHVVKRCLNEVLTSPASNTMEWGPLVTVNAALLTKSLLAKTIQTAEAGVFPLAASAERITGWPFHAEKLGQIHILHCLPPRKILILHL
jgi:hypothetical protein